MLGDTYGLAGRATLQRLRRELVLEFEEAFAAAEPDLREWMPAAAKEQENAAKFIDSCTEAFRRGTTFAYGIVSPAGKMIGYVNVTPAPGHAVVGYWVRPDSRGRGVAPLAVRVLTDATFAALEDVERIHAHLDAGNIASRHVLEKAGFRYQQLYNRPPRTSTETDTEWLYVRDRYPRGCETDRLLLRDLDHSDLEAMVRLWTDADVARFMDDFGPRSRGEVERWIPEALHAGRSVPRFRSWGIERKATGEVVGWLGFGSDGRVGDIDFAYIVDADHRGEGYAIEALRAAVAYCFTVLGAESFWGQCHTDNEASAAAMRGAGLEFIGTVEGQHRFRAARVDVGG